MEDRFRMRPWRMVLMTIFSLLFAIGLGGAQCARVGTRPSPTAPRPTRMTRPAPRSTRMTTPAPAPTRVTRRAPARTPGDLRAAIDRTRRDVEAGDWTKARTGATEVGSAWQPIRTGRNWSAADMAAFETNYTKLRTAISARSRDTALRALAELSRLSARNVSRAPVAPTRAVRPRPTAPRGTRMMAPRR